MNKIAGSPAAIAFREAKRKWVPIATILLASLLSTLPLVTTLPVIPSFGFLTILAWRLMRPEIWIPAYALGFGLFDDLVAGHPLGQSMALWTIVLLVLDFLDTRFNYRDFWIDWLCATGMIILHAAGAWYVARLMHAPVDMLLMLPQAGLAILLYPLIARIVVRLDRWRLAR